VRRLNAVLYVVALLLACGTVIGGVLVWRQDDTEATAAATQSRYGAVQSAATAEVEAMLNVRYDDAQATIDKVLAGATGKFKKQYENASDGMVQLLKLHTSVMTGEVVWAGVSSIDADSATVITATEGTVANKASRNQPVARNFRLQLELVNVDGTWLTDNLTWLPDNADAAGGTS
jgi:Mce-associated membrane protein